jgi:hypothetical protein
MPWDRAMRPSRFTPVTLAIALASLISLRAADTLDIYFIDVEGGQATLIATPAGESLLIDTGYGRPRAPEIPRTNASPISTRRPATGSS